MVRMKEGATRTEEGMVFPKGGMGYAKIENWEWGGTISVGVFMKCKSNFGSVLYFDPERREYDVVFVCKSERSIDSTVWNKRGQQY